MKILYLVHELPLGIPSGLKIRIEQIIKTLAKKGELTVVGFIAAEQQSWQRVTGNSIVKDTSVDFVSVPHSIRIHRHPLELAKAFFRSALKSLPYSIAKFHSKRMHDIVASLLRDQEPQIVVATLPMWQYVSDSTDVKRVLDSHNIEHEMWQAALPYLHIHLRALAWRESCMLRSYERAVWTTASESITICEEDSAVIRSAAGPRTDLIPVEIECREAWSSDSTVDRKSGSIGMIAHWGWHPNKVAMHHFVDVILPRLTGVKIVVAGTGLVLKARRQLERSEVQVMGEIENVNEFYSQVDIICAPYLYGGGVRIKIAEALTRGKLVIGYPLAFRGFTVQPNVRCVANESELVRELIASSMGV